MSKISTVGRPKEGQDTGSLMANHMSDLMSESLTESLAGVTGFKADVDIDDAPADIDIKFFDSTDIGSLNTSGRSELSVVKTASSKKEKEDVFGNYVSDKVFQEVESLREDMIKHFQKFGSHKEISPFLEKCIKKLERVELHLGVKSKRFEPIRHKTGLKTKDTLENANTVVGNTIDCYDLHSVYEITSGINNKKPAIVIAILGQNEESGFIVKGVVTAKSDFSGNEAIDYVFDKNGGLITVKSFVSGSWKDVSSNFSVSFDIEETDLKQKSGYHTMFLGEQVISQGKDMFKKQLNLNDNEIIFSDSQVFVKNAEVLDSIKGILNPSLK